MFNNQLEALPTELLEHITFNLDRKSVVNLLYSFPQISQRLQHNASFWRKLYNKCVFFEGQPAHQFMPNQEHLEKCCTSHENMINNIKST